MTVKTYTVVDFQWNDDTPYDSPAYDEIRDLWKYYGFGNDHYYIKWEDCGDEKRWPAISAYLKTLPQEHPFLLHWWW